MNNIVKQQEPVRTVLLTCLLIRGFSPSGIAPYSPWRGGGSDFTPPGDTEGKCHRSKHGLKMSCHPNSHLVPETVNELLTGMSSIRTGGPTAPENIGCYSVLWEFWLQPRSVIIMMMILIIDTHIVYSNTRFGMDSCISSCWASSFRRHPTLLPCALLYHVTCRVPRRIVRAEPWCACIDSPVLLSYASESPIVLTLLFYIDPAH